MKSSGNDTPSLTQIVHIEEVFIAGTDWPLHNGIFKYQKKKKNTLFCGMFMKIQLNQLWSPVQQQLDRDLIGYVRYFI